jgi:hypothetical protein
MHDILTTTIEKPAKVLTQLILETDKIDSKQDVKKFSLRRQRVANQ